MLSIQRAGGLGALASAALVLGLLLAMASPGFSAGHSSAPAPISPAAVPATAKPYQFAFGGSYSSSWSCTTSGCPGGNLTVNQTLSLSWNININWAVIYTQTNVSATQTEYSVQAAVGASVSFSYSACISDPSCQTASASVSLGGHESLSGYTNVTNTGQVDLTGGAGSPATVGALAIMNAAAHEAFNLSGSFSLQEPATTWTSAASDSASFDVGGLESSGIDFSTPLGLVPTSVAPGDNWTATEPYTASGNWKGGVSVTATVNGKTESIDEWGPGSVATSGTLTENGTDLGTTTLTDTHTTPPTSVTVQEIVLNFSGGNFSAADGWVLCSTAVLNGIASETDLYVPEPAQVALPTPSLSPVSLLGSLTSTESTYYTAQNGFVGSALAGDTTTLSGGTVHGPNVNLMAGPEPVSVAEGQYSSILSSSSSGGFPWLVVPVVAVVVVVVAAVLLVRARAARRRPPAPTAFSVSPAEPVASPPMPPAQGGA